MVRRPVVLQEGPSALGEGHERRAAIAFDGRHAANEARTPQPFQVAVPEIPRSSAGHRADRSPARRETSRSSPARALRSRGVGTVFAHVDAFALAPTREVEAGREDVPGVPCLGFPRIAGARLSGVERAGIESGPT